MAFTITKKEGLDKEYYGYETEYHIDFTFKKQKANVTIEIDNESLNTVRLCSNTDGYHWLQYFLCQMPNCDSLLKLGFNEEVNRCKMLFLEHNIEYEQEGKETAYLTYNGAIDETFITTIANIIEPRFANRERFFND